MLPMLEELINAGVSSLKIEGRMKRPEYVACVTAMYRHAIDNIARGKKAYTQEDMDELLRMFNRGGFMQGYLKGRRMSAVYSSHCANQGTVVGSVLKVEKDKATVRLTKELRKEDIIEYGQSPNSVRVDVIYKNGQMVESAVKGDSVVVRSKDATVGDKVRLVVDSAQHEYWRSRVKENLKKLPVDMEITVRENEPISLKISDRLSHSGQVEAQPAQTAQNAPIPEEKIVAQLSKMGNTPYEADNIIIHTDNNSWVPLSAINELRRNAVDELNRIKLEELKNRYTVASADLSIKDNGQHGKTEVCVQIASLKGKSIPDCAIYYAPHIYSDNVLPEIKQFREKNKNELWFVLPNVAFEDDMSVLDRILGKIKNDITGVLISNIGQIPLAKRHGLAMRGNWSLNVFNSKCVEFYRSLGIEGITASPELKLSEIKRLQATDIEIVGYGRLQLMAFAYCHNNGQCAKCNGEDKMIQDRSNRIFPIKRVKCANCVSYMLNSDVLDISDKMSECSCIARIRLLLDEAPEKAEDVADRFIRAIAGETVKPYDKRTSGHYFRGVE
jgi:putative protease